MRISLTAVVLAALVGLSPVAGSDVSAAELSVKTKKRVAHHHRRAIVVRDYDGTPIVLRRGPRVTMGDGRTRRTAVAVPAPRAQPVRYLNGQPVWPTTRVRVVRRTMRD
jgi:hypothetical protein